MNMQNSRSKKLLNKVYDHLETVDVAKLSISEMRDFLEVVQKGQFLESFGQMPPYSFGMCASSPFNGTGKPADTADKQE